MTHVAVAIDKTSHEGGCWLWLGARDWRGYGVATTRREGKRGSTTAHRAVYQSLGGLIPPGMELDHLCRTRLCVNPDHLEVVTHAENSRRASHWWGAKSHCVRGHEFSPENTAPRADHPGRTCRACARERTAAYRLRRRTA